MQQGHSVLYRTRPTRWRAALEFLVADFPLLVRSQARSMWVALAMTTLIAILVWKKVPGLITSGLDSGIAEIRKQLDEAMVQATRYANQIARVENEESLDKVKKSGKTVVYVPTKEERLAFKKAMVPVHKKMESRIGAELIQSIYKETGFDPAAL